LKGMGKKTQDPQSDSPGAPRSTPRAKTNPSVKPFQPPKIHRPASPSEGTPEAADDAAAPRPSEPYTPFVKTVSADPSASAASFRPAALDSGSGADAFRPGFIKTTQSGKLRTQAGRPIFPEFGPGAAAERPSAAAERPGGTAAGAERPGAEAEPLGAKGARPDAAKDSKYRKVAKLVVLLGQEEGARILAKLDAEQVDGIAREIARISTIDPGEADRILTEFKSLFSSFSGQALNNAGGIPAARHLLYKAFGKEKGEALLKRAVPESQENPFSFLEDMEGEHAALLLKDESPTMAAMVLSRVSPKTAAAVLGSMEASKRMPLLRGMAGLGKINPDVLEQVAAAMREKARSIGSVESRGVDGKSALAAILRNTDPSFGDKLLEELEEEDPELSRDLKERIYTLDDVVRSDDRSIQERLRSMADRDIALLLKGRSPEFIDKLRSNLSAGRRTIIEQERELLGPVPKKDVEVIAGEFLSWFRRGIRDGKIRIDGDSTYI